MLTLLTFLFAVGVFAIGSFIFVPVSLTRYLCWKQTQKPSEFSGFVLTASYAVFLVAFSYFVLGFVLHKNDVENWPTWIRFLTAGALICLTYYLFLPQGLHFAKKWVVKKNPIDFSWMLLHFFCAFCAISFPILSFWFFCLIGENVS